MIKHRAYKKILHTNTYIFIDVRVNFCKRRMERARSVISDSDLRLMEGGTERERSRKREKENGGIESNRADGQERNFFGRTAAAEQRTRDIKEEFLRAHVALAREREREKEREKKREKRERENLRLIQGTGYTHEFVSSLLFQKFRPPLSLPRNFIFLLFIEKNKSINIKKVKFLKN